MVSSSTQPASRYRRRILGLGAVATGALYVIGAPFFVDRIETDLESRVPIELAEQGFEGLTAEFSGQDGTLFCERPVRNPDGALAAAFDIHGVRTIDFDDESPCRSLIADDAADESTADDDATSDSSDDASEQSDSTDEDSTDETVTETATTDVSPSTTDAGLATIDEVVAADPNLRFLSVLLGEVPDATGPVTLFAPSDAAFDALPAEVAALLQNDTELRQAFLDHHTVPGALVSTEFVDGALEAVDGSELTVTTGEVATIDGASLVDFDIAASNGVVHVIDSVLPFDALEVPGAVEPAAASATFDGGSIVLDGVVASEVERNVLVTAAVDAVGVGNVVDDLMADPDTGLGAATSAELAALVAAMPANLVSGEAGFDGEALFANGIAASAEGGDAFRAAASAVGVDAAIDSPPAATADDAVDLEAELNAFVAENPILFQPTSAVLDESAAPILDRVAADLQTLAAISITVEGHTDSDGSPDVNLALSQARAAAVREALIERGVAADSVDAVGFGSEQPVLVDGVEDKNASRRVEFRVVAAS